jgi:2-desacetyl-2-hydroxyethyl bacteriochlorophyllide A dehydrogenase
MSVLQIPSSSTAVVCSVPGSVAIEDAILPKVGDRDVLVRTLVSGVSTGTDKWVINGRFDWGDFGFPLVPGYQRVGVVAAVGTAVDSVNIDDLVFATSSRDFGNVTAGWGAHARWAVSEENEVFPLPGVSGVSEALAVSLQVGVNAASRLTNPKSQRVLVIGDGVIGVSSALAARDSGCTVMVAGHHDNRLAALRSAHDDLTTVNSHEGWVEILAQWEPTAVIDTIQNSRVTDEYVAALPCTWNSASTSSTRSGVAEIVFAGHSPDGVTSWADMALLQKFEVTTHFVSGWTRERIKHTLELVGSGRISLDPFVTTYRAETRECDQMLRDVADASFPAIAACIDWGAP